MKKLVVGEAYMQKIHEIFKLPLLDTRVTPIGTPLSSSTSNNTYIWICLPNTFEYIGNPLGLLKPSLVKLIGCLVVTLH